MEIIKHNQASIAETINHAAIEKEKSIGLSCLTGRVLSYKCCWGQRLCV